MRLGYNTNGLAHHRLTDAIRLLADEGFRSVAITLDAAALDPFGDPIALMSQIEEIRTLLDKSRMTCVIETGARYLLNPRMKHDPTLMDPDPVRRNVRIDFLKRAIDLASELNAEAMSFWSGILRDDASEVIAMGRLVEALKPVLDHSELRDVRLAFEPEPGMFIDTLARFAELDRRLAHPRFQMTMDLGHVHCNEEGAVADHILAWARGSPTSTSRTWSGASTIT